MSADIAGYDVPMVKGAQFAIDKINASGGVAGKKLELIVKDNKDDKALAVQTTQELLDEGIGYLIGTTGDSVVACGRLAQDQKVPSSTGDGSAPNLVDEIGPFAFQLIMNDCVQGAAMAEYAYNDLGYRNVWLLKSTAMPYTLNLPDYFGEAFTRLGGTIGGEINYTRNSGDFSTQVTKIQNASPTPDAVYSSMFLAGHPDVPQAAAGSWRDHAVPDFRWQRHQRIFSALEQPPSMALSSLPTPTRFLGVLWRSGTRNTRRPTEGRCPTPSSTPTATTRSRFSRPRSKRPTAKVVRRCAMHLRI